MSWFRQLRADFFSALLLITVSTRATFFLVCGGLLGVSFPPTRTGISLQKSHVSSRIHPILSALLDYDTPNPASSSEDDGISNHRSLHNPFRDFLFLRVSKHNFLLFRKA